MGKIEQFVLKVVDLLLKALIIIAGIAVGVLLWWLDRIRFVI